MPGFDKTGPQGQGPMKGGKRGRCSWTNQGFGFNRGMGRGNGQGFRRNNAEKESELHELKAQISQLGDKVTSLTKQVSEQMAKDKP